MTHLTKCNMQTQKCELCQLDKPTTPYPAGGFHLTQPHPHARKRKHGRSLTVMPWTTTDEFNVIPKTQWISLASFPGQTSKQLLSYSQRNRGGEWIGWMVRGELANERDRSDRTDRQKYRQKIRQPDWCTDWCTDRRTDIPTDVQTDGHTNRPTERRTDRQSKNSKTK